MEVYNEQLFDLLSPLGVRTKLDPREDSVRRTVVVAGLTEQKVLNADDLLLKIAEGNARRRMEPTAANAVSSRSHAVLELHVAVMGEPNSTTSSSKTTSKTASKTAKLGGTSNTKATLALIDLAGSERAARTQNSGMRLTEGANINKSLLALANCINALCRKTSSRVK